MLRRSIRLLRHAEKFCFCKFKVNFNQRMLYSAYDKDFPNPSLPTPVSKLYSHDTDILLEQIKTAKTIPRLLELVSMHLNVMNVKHIVESMLVIHEMSKNPDFRNVDLLENKIFQNLCSQLMKMVRLLEPNEVVSVYKTLSTIGIRNNTYVMQSVLKMIGAHLNNMSLGQLTFLNFLLSKQKPNSLVDGLKLALPLVLQVQIEQQLDSNNVNEIVDCLRLACRSRMKSSTIEKILAVLCEKANLLTPDNAMSILFALFNLDTPVDGYKQLMNYSFDLLSKNENFLSVKQIKPILRLCHIRGQYNSRFFFVISNKIITEKWNFEDTYELVIVLCKLNFAPNNLLDYFSEIIISESEALTTNLSFSPLTCVEYLTCTGYQPKNVTEALEVLCSCEELIEDKLRIHSPNLLIKFVSCLSIFGYFPEKYFKEILDEDFLFEAWSLSKKQGRGYDFEINMLSLISSLYVYEKTETYKFPPLILQKLLSTLAQRSTSSEPSLESFIEHGLGGSQFSQNCMFTNEGILIDHVVVMRTGNYPVSIGSADSNSSISKTLQNIKFVEDIVLPEDSKIVSIIVANKDKFCNDPEVLKGWMEIRIRCLKKKKYCPVVVNYQNFMNMPDREKIPFLMREIKHAVEEENSIKSNVSS